MAPLLYGYGFGLLTAIVVIAGDAILKIAADGGHSVHHRYVLTGCALYGLSALMWFGAMQHVSLTQAGLAYAMLTLLALCAIDVLWFGERVGAREAAGVACALAAMVLMVRVG